MMEAIFLKDELKILTSLTIYDSFMQKMEKNVLAILHE